jgi:hypothetical protein
MKPSHDDGGSDIERCQDALERARLALVEASKLASPSQRMVIHIHDASRDVALAMAYSEMLRRGLTSE